jgi:hypothetical protein
MYKYINQNCITRLADGINFPIANGNSDYEECKRWIAAGNVVQAADPVVAPRITKVTMRQARLALLGAGYLSTINAAIANMAGAAGEAARIEWEYSQEVQRDRGLVLSLGTSLGLTESQLDALFATAAAIP